MNFNLELVSKVNFGGESVNFKKNDVGELQLCIGKKQNKTCILTCTLNHKQKINSKWFVDPNLFLLEKDIEE